MSVVWKTVRKLSLSLKILTIVAKVCANNWNVIKNCRRFCLNTARKAVRCLDLSLKVNHGVVSRSTPMPRYSFQSHP